MIKASCVAKQLSCVQSLTKSIDSVKDIPQLLFDCNYNWFEFMDCVVNQEEDILSLSKSIYDKDQEKLHLVRQSYYAFSAIEEQAYEQNHTARTLNGEIVSESESDDPNVYLGVTDASSAEGKKLVMKKRKAIQRRARRKQEKVVAEKHFLSHRVPKRVFSSSVAYVTGHDNQMLMSFVGMFCPGKAEKILSEDVLNHSSFCTCMLPTARSFFWFIELRDPYDKSIMRSKTTELRSKLDKIKGEVASLMDEVSKFEVSPSMGTHIMAQSLLKKDHLLT